MKKISILIASLIMSSMSFASSCPDGNEPIKSVSDDGTYYIFTCNESNSNSNNALGNAKSSSKDSKSESNDSEIKIYEVSFAPEVLDLSLIHI